MKAPVALIPLAFAIALAHAVLAEAPAGDVPAVITLGELAKVHAPVAFDHKSHAINAGGCPHPSPTVPRPKRVLSQQAGGS
jgi:hypothetical protein